MKHWIMLKVSNFGSLLLSLLLSSCATPRKVAPTTGEQGGSPTVMRSPDGTLYLTKDAPAGSVPANALSDSGTPGSNEPKARKAGKVAGNVLAGLLVGLAEGARAYSAAQSGYTAYVPTGFASRASTPTYRRSFTSTQIGDTIFHSSGGSSNRIGNTWFHSGGGTSTMIGNTMFHSGGSSSTRIGNTVFHSDGTSSNRIGNTIFHSDGGTSTRIGNTIFHSP